MNVPDYLHKVFAIDPQTGNYVVEILLEKYMYAFNEWDSSYFRRRDLDPDLIHFLESCSNEIPLHYRIDLSFTVSQPKDEEMEQLVEASIRNYCKYTLVLQRRSLKRLLWNTVKYVGLAIVFLLMGIIFEPVMPRQIVGRALLEGLHIGGWVFLWEAISLLSFNRSGISTRLKEYNRLVKAQIRFTYGDKPIRERSGDFPDGAGARKKEAIKGQAQEHGQ